MNCWTQMECQHISKAWSHDWQNAIHTSVVSTEWQRLLKRRLNVKQDQCIVFLDASCLPGVEMSLLEYKAGKATAYWEAVNESCEEAPSWWHGVREHRGASSIHSHFCCSWVREYKRLNTWGSTSPKWPTHQGATQKPISSQLHWFYHLCSFCGKNNIIFMVYNIVFMTCTQAPITWAV